MTEPRTRAEHLAWCKSRALEYLDRDGNVPQAITSMMSDLTKHPETKASAGSLATLALWEAARSDAASARKFIEGFN